MKLRYRKLCPPCAQETGRCPQCSKSQKEQELEDRMKRNSSGEENEEEDTTDDEAYIEEGDSDNAKMTRIFSTAM